MLRTTSPLIAGASGEAAGLEGSVDQHQADAAARRRGKLLGLEMLAVDVSGSLDRGARRHVVELRAAVLVGLHREHFGSDVQLHGMTGDVIRQLAANQADGDGALWQIVNRARDPRHLLWIGHREARVRAHTKDTKDTKEKTDLPHAWPPQPYRTARRRRSRSSTARRRGVDRRVDGPVFRRPFQPSRDRVRSDRDTRCRRRAAA